MTAAIVKVTIVQVGYTGVTSSLLLHTLPQDSYLTLIKYLDNNQ